jgi:protein O-mannosyl-transferase
LFVAGLAAKPMVITLPFVLLLLDYWPLNRVRHAGSDAGSSWPRLILEKMPLIALSAASAMITMKAQQAGGAVRSTVQFSLSTRVANAIYAYAMYLWKMIWPARLAPLYPHPAGTLATWQVVTAALVLIAITMLVWKFRELRYLMTGWLWFLGTLVPVIGLVQVGDAAMADRYAYIPLIGIFVMIAFGAADLAETKKFGMLSVVPAVCVLVALAAATHRQIDYWRSNYDLWSHTLAVTQNNFIAEDNLGGALILEGKEEEAHPHFEAAARINPKDPMSRSNLGTYFQTHNQMREAVAEYEDALGLTSDPGLLAQTYSNLGAAYRAMGEDTQARESFMRALQLNSHLPSAWFGLGLVARQQGMIEEALSDLSRSLDLHPTAQAYFELGRTLEQAGRVPEAMAAYQQALQIAPDFLEAQQATGALQQRSH